MKRTLKYIFLAFLVAVLSGCVQELPDLRLSDGDLAYPESGKVVIQMSVEIPGQRMPSTKTMADLPDIDNFRVVVFGSSGFLKESVDVASDDFVAATTNGNSTLYTLNVHLSVTDSKRLRINVIANCNKRFPWKNEDVVMNQSAYTEGTQDAYWCRFTLPNGITLKKEYDPETQSMEYVKDGDYYCVTDDVTTAFTGLALLRNFAKVSVESTTPQLVLDPTTTMAVINRPDRGSVAPYNEFNAAFIDDYKDYEYAELKSSYNGFAPASMKLIDSDPDAVTFVPCGKDGNGNITGGQFIFERPKPGTGDARSYLIIHGTYYPLKSGVNRAELPDNWKTIEADTPGTYLSTTGTPCYYKIDFSDNDGYYAILRNFRYHIRITSVSKVGAETPAEAGSTGGSSDISSSQEAVHLTDISDGYGRIAVSYIERTLVQADPAVELKYKFIPNAEDGDNGIDNRLVSEGGPVTITIGPKTESSPINVISSTLDSQIGTGTDIGDDNNGRIRVLSSSQTDAEGYRIIKFTANNPSGQEKAEQTIRITGAIAGHNNIYRDVKFILMKKQDMTVECVADEVNSDYGPNYVEDISGEGVNVNITIPILLPESVFPLIFNIESSKLSLTPNTAKYTDENLPVESGYSICDGQTSKKSFHYVKTLSFAEYNALPDNGGKTFTCHFKTNMSDNACTVYVDNEYFNKGSASYSNYTMYKFSGLAFSSYSVGAGNEFTFSFNLDSRDNTRPRTVQVSLDGLAPGTNSGLEVINADDGIYSYAVNSGNSASIRLKAVAAGYNGLYGVTLAAFDNNRAIYTEAEHSTEDYIATFSNLGFYNRNNNTYSTTNSLALGMDQPVYFRFDYENGHIYPVTFILTGLTTDDSRLVNNGDGTYTFTPTDNNQSQYVQLKSNTRFSAVTVKISNTRYNPVDAKTLNRPTSFTIPAQSLIASSNVFGNNDRTVTFYRTEGTDWWGNTTYSDNVGSGTFSRQQRYNTGDITITISGFTNPSENTPVYLTFSTGNGWNSTSYRATTTLGALMDATSQNKLSLTFTTY